jgi:signal transduction histidine kinase
MAQNHQGENSEKAAVSNFEKIEELVRERTAELKNLNRDLKREISERKKAEEQLEQRTHLLSTLLDVSNLVSSTLDLGPLLEAILDRLKKIIDYKGAKIFAIEDGILRIVAHRSLLTKEETSNYTFSALSIPLGKEIIEEKRAVVISDILGDEPAAIEFRTPMESFMKTVHKNTRSWMGIPLTVKNKVIGALTIDHDEPNFYLPQHAELGMVFANQAAIEFENARLYNETIKKADELKTMFSVQQAITSRLEQDAVLKLIADEARRLTNSGRTAVFLVNGNDLVLSVFSGTEDKRFLGYRIDINNSFLGKYLIAGKTVTVNDTLAEPEAYFGLAEKVKIKSFLSVPLIAGTRLIGTITVADKISGNFSADDERILNMLASSAIIGLENSRLYQEEKIRHLEDEQRRRVAEGLRDILAILNSNRPLEEIIEFIVNQAGRLMSTDTVALYRLESKKELLTVEASCGLSEEYKLQMSVPVGTGVIGRAVKERKPISIPDIVGEFQKYFDNSDAEKNHLSRVSGQYHGVLAVPLKCKDEVYGGIALYYTQIKEFTKDEIELAMIFADQAALAIDNARLRAQAEEMAVASERSRLARDLHDAVTQTLFSASLIAEVLPKIWQRNPDEGIKRINEIRELTRGALAEMRTLLLELRPSALLEAGIKELLNQLTLGFTGRSRIPVSLDIEGQLALPADVKLAFYRIAQEALNNISKHSGANHVDLSFKSSDNEGGSWAELRISDDGKGFALDGISSDHLGLNIMHERAIDVSARLDIESQIGKGTVILVRWGGE